MLTVLYIIGAVIATVLLAGFLAYLLLASLIVHAVMRGGRR